MAEGTIKLFAEKLGVMVVEEYKFLQGVEGHVMSLRDELQWISSFLKDAAVHRSNHERVDVWVSQIRDLAYDAEDVLDIFIHKVKRRLRERNIRRLINYPSHLITLHKLGNQIDSINKRIERISTYKSKYAIDKLEDKDSLGKDVAFNKTRAPDIEEDDVVDFNTRAGTVVRMLLEREEDSSQLHVVSIVGMPGAGKSTLALKAYNDVKKENKFDSHAWIYVSQEFKSQILLQSIMDQNSKKENQSIMDQNSKKENQGMKDKNRRKEENPTENDMGKLLVVFDDVWRIQDWEELYTNVLKKIKSEEITVLLTSRSSEVATHANSRMKPFNMEKLDKEEGLELLKKKVFHKENFPSDDLKEVAEKIVEKCHGLPLAIVVLGGLLSTKQKTIDVWNKVLGSASWHLFQGSTDCLELIALSYDNLPNFLKPCFLYFGLFPEDEPIDCEKLIQLWMAEGFIQERGEEAMEDVAEDYLEELIQRNMVQVEEWTSNGRPERCLIHDVLREFAISKGRQDKFLDIFMSKASRTMSRRFGFHSTKEESEEDPSALPDGSSLISPHSINARSMLCFDELSGGRLFKDKSFYKSFGLLRVLDLRSAPCSVERLPDEIGKLILLKYLNLSGVAMLKTLPSSIRNLRNLQTLDISDTEINGIPWSVYELEELRHLYANTYIVRDDEDGNGFSCNPLGCKIIDHCNLGGSGIGRLRNIRTLCTFVDNRIGDDDLSRLTNLRKLWLSGKDVDHYGTALSNSMSTRKFIYLRELVLGWVGGKLQFPHSLKEYVHLYRLVLSGVIENLPTEPDAFPPNLTEMGLSCTALDQEEGDPMKTLAELKNLKIFSLGEESFLGKQLVFPAGGFRKLTDLEISDIP